MMNLLRRSRLAVKLSLGFRPFSNSSRSYDLTNFTKQYNHLIKSKDTPLLVNYGNGFFQMLTSTFLYSGKDAIIKIPPVSVQLLKDFVVCGPCHGLFCFYSADGEVFLWNPCTGDTKSLTDNELHFDQKIETQNVGFGFDSKANDYKIVRSISRLFLNPQYKSADKIIDQVEIYSLKTKQWREIPVHLEITSNLPLLSAGSFFADGAFYWSVEEVTLADDNDRTMRLISLDFEEEKFHLHTLHLVSPCRPVSCKMDSLDGCPAAICVDTRDIQVWKGRRESGGVITWDFEFKIKSLNCYDFTPLCFCNNEKGLILLDEETGMLLLYDFERQCIHQSCVYVDNYSGGLKRGKKRFQVLNFSEVLAPNVC